MNEKYVKNQYGQLDCYVHLPGDLLASLRNSFSSSEACFHFFSIAIAFEKSLKSAKCHADSSVYYRFITE